MKVLIVGGVAGGASAAARLRRNDEHAKIVLMERGDYISYANCGLPYYIGGVIHEKSKLTLQTPQSFRQRFRVDVRTGNEVVSIDPKAKKVTVTRTGDGSAYEESYDKLLLSPGSEPLRPRLPGFDGKKVFTLRSIPDTYRIREFCDTNKPGSAVVIGGGYIGIEIAENLHRLGIRVTIVELSGHVIPPVDYDTAAQLHNHMRSKGVGLKLGTGVESIDETADGLVFTLSSGSSLKADFAVLAAGVAPESKLAFEAGLKTGLRGAIAVDETLKTSDPDIYAVGDAVEVTSLVSGMPAFIPLASPANKQGRIAADNICGGNEKYEGSLGSSILKVFDLTLAATGLSETALHAAGIPYRKSFTYSPSNASYYPGALPMSLKLLFSPENGRILGAQAVGFNGVDKRVDVIAAVLRLGGTVRDLTKLELCYAPPFSSAKDPVNMAGYTAENILNGKFEPFYPEDVAQLDLQKSVLLDVRTEDEFESGSIPGAVSMPLDSLRETMASLPKDREIDVFCQIGLRGYLASRILLQSGFANVRNLSGGYRLWRELENDKTGTPAAPQSGVVETETQLAPQRKAKEIVVDACGLSCPGPILAVHKAMEGAEEGDVFTVRATDPAFAGDIEAFCRRTGNELLSSGFDGKCFSITIRKGTELQNRNVSDVPAANDKSIIVFSGDLDKAIASFIIANGAAAMGRKVHMFFTFWGLNILRKDQKVGTGKDLIGKLFGFMMPRGSRKLKLSRMNMGGLGAKMIRSVMHSKNISSLEDLIQEAIRGGVEITACSMSMDVMGLRPEELIDGIKVGGVASFLASAEESDASLFI
jgi:NADPH-dependent 2,4-dienoyl-CoA reductase/sulfur reductase-like enzyme/peroxiredoxin family protein/rhodanese-related sulfurtransferase/TusA-related sulfurtransferase